MESKGTQLRRGQLVLVCAGPGVGKSGFILSYAVKSRVPTFYFSADSDSFTQLSRTVSIISGWPLARSTQAVIDEDLGEFEEELDSIPIRFNYSASPSLDDIYDSLRAYEALYEEFPALIIIDNITNVRTDASDGEDPFAGLESLSDYLHEMGRETDACVVGLHHVTGKYNDGDIPIPLSGIKGQVSRVPELILTLHKAGVDGEYLNVSTVKNRSGKADPSGYSFAELRFDKPKMQITDFG